MATLKIQHCFNCGQDIGVFQAWPGDILDCGKRECSSAAQEGYRERDDDARERASDDDYGRYR